MEPMKIRLSLHYQENPVRGEELIATCFKEAHALQIVGFVFTTPPEETIVVNCAAGISRSPGVVLAFERFYGRDTAYIYERAVPNSHVATVLGKVLSTYDHNK
jgi:predicted protein tyrosine phosphatase